MNERVSNEQAQGYIDGELATFKRLKVRRQDVKDIRLNAFEDLLDARRQRDEARAAVAWITGSSDVEAVIAGALAARAAAAERALRGKKKK